jgi:beta-phosphoglucomutase
MKVENEYLKNIELKINENTILFFDMDGTLIDTNLANFLSYKKAIKSVFKSDISLSYNPEKRFNRSDLEITCPNLDKAEYSKIIQQKEENYDEFLHETKIIDEVADILKWYSKTHRTVLVTNSRQERAIKTLNHFGLSDLFRDKFYRQFSDGNERINKFTNALLKLDISPNLVLAFENEETEIEDAKKVGIQKIIKI